MKIEIVYPKRAFDDQFNTINSNPSELIREVTAENALLERRRKDSRPLVLLLSMLTEQSFEQVCKLMRRLHDVEAPICDLANHFYVIVNGLTPEGRNAALPDEPVWQRQAEILYTLGVDEVHSLPMLSPLMSTRLQSLSKRMHERVRHQQAGARYEDAQELGNIGSWLHDFTNNQTWWSNKVYEIFQREKHNSPPGMEDYIAMIHPDDRANYVEEMRRCVEEGVPLQVEHRIVRGDGSTGIVCCWGKPNVSERGELVEISGVVQDVTHLRHAQNDLRHHEAALSFITDGAPAMLYSLRMDCDEVLWVDYYSIGSIQNFGRRLPVKGERLEPFMQRYFSQELYDEILKQCLESAHNLTPWSREFRIEDDLGDSRWISGRSMPARLDDGSFIWRGVLDDITEYKHLQEQLQLADRLSSIGTLAAGIAHEINNPLSFIMSNLEYTLDETKRFPDYNKDNEVELALLSALDGARRISSIVKGLMTYARQNDDLDEVVDLNEVIQTALRITSNQFRYRTELCLELGRQLMVIGNEGQLCQIFVNLILNALLAMPPERTRGNIITIRVVQPDSAAVACVEIEDNGIGIPDAMQKRLFDPFYSTRGVGQGTGLGLYVCRNMVAAMNGSLELVKTSSSGSVFRVILRRVGSSS